MKITHRLHVSINVTVDLSGTDWEDTQRQNHLARSSDWAQDQFVCLLDKISRDMVAGDVAFEVDTWEKVERNVKTVAEQEEAGVREEERYTLAGHYYDLWECISSAGFDYDSWHRGEQDLIKPRLEAKGFTNIRFAMGECDSFGPLTRVVLCNHRDGHHVRFMYG